MAERVVIIQVSLKAGQKTHSGYYPALILLSSSFLSIWANASSSQEIIYCLLLPHRDVLSILSLTKLAVPKDKKYIYFKRPSCLKCILFIAAPHHRSNVIRLLWGISIKWWVMSDKPFAAKLNQFRCQKSLKIPHPWTFKLRPYDLEMSNRTF